MTSKNNVGNGIFLAIGGPSGAGKSAVIEKLKNLFGMRIYGSVAYTTRLPRKDEVDGVHYHFVKASQISKYQNDPRFGNFVSARGNWYWVDLAELINKFSGKDRIYLTSITQVHEFIERRRLFPNLHWIWLTAPNHVLCSRLKKRGDADIDQSLAHNELLEKQDRSKLISLEINTSIIKFEETLNQIIRFMKKLMEENI